MRGMLLAAGFGTRLRPIARDLPKPLVPVFGRPVLDHGLSALVTEGIHEIVVNAAYRGRVVAEWVEAKCLGGATLTLSREPEPLGTGGGVAAVRSFLSETDTFGLLNGDILARPPFRVGRSAVLDTGAAAALFVTTRPDLPERLRKVAWDEAGRVVEVDGVAATGDRRRAVARGVYCGALVGTDRFLSALPEEGKACLKEDGFWPLLRRGETLVAVPLSSYWSDMGTPDRYLSTHTELLALGGEDFLPRHAELVSPGVWMAPDVTVSDRAMLVPPLAVDSGATIGAGARVGPAVYVGAGATIAPGIRVENAVVWSRVSVTTDAVGEVRQ